MAQVLAQPPLTETGRAVAPTHRDAGVRHPSARATPALAPTRRMMEAA
jgi:hypothetical protein